MRDQYDGPLGKQPRAMERRCEHCGRAFWATVTRVERGQARFCAPRCWSAYRRERPLHERLWEHTDTSDPAACWEWPGFRHDNGYGRLSAAGRTWATHRLAWELAYGPIPVGLLVCHSCDHRACTNPAHLFLGSHADNMRDMREKGRAARGERNGALRYPERRPRGARNGASTHPERLARGDRHGSRTRPERLARGDRHKSVTSPERTPRGEAHGNARLDDAAVREIRRRYAAGGVTGTALAREFGVSNAPVYEILRGRAWKHVH